MAEIRVYQSLWATEHRRPGWPELPTPARFDAVKQAGFDGMAIDLGALDIAAARECASEYSRTGLRALLTAFPTSIEALRPALHLAKDIGAPFVIVVGQVMPLAVHDMVPVVRQWLRVSQEESMPIQFETHRNCITNNLFATLQLLEAVPQMRLSADLSHYVVEREMMQPIPAQMQEYVLRVLQRSDSFQGRIATRNQIQVPIAFPQHRVWLDTFLGWWREGFRLWRSRCPDEEPIFMCELGPPNYAMTDANGHELSDRWQEALELQRLARALWAEIDIVDRPIQPGVRR